MDLAGLIGGILGLIVLKSVCPGVPLTGSEPAQVEET
jgi:hypothetical protein